MFLARLRFSPKRRYPIGRPAVSLAIFFLSLALNLTGQAGDILRGGAGSGQSRGTASETGNPTAAAVQAGVNGLDTLARTTQALNAVQAMQAAAHTAAARGANNLGLDPNHPGQQLPNVPNGLTTGGLVPDSGLASQGVANAARTWTNARTPTQSTGSGKTDVTIVQTAQQALLNWQTFNIGKGTTLTFDQTGGGASASQWIAFNKVNDPSGVPSQILGSLDAIGQVYIINANGIIFGGSSQINLHTLVASALPINDNLIARGLLNNPDNQFLFSALPILPGSNGTPAFTPPASNAPDGHYGDVVVQEGGTIASPSTADHVGGRVALIGANASNAGTISTPDGQTILASGLQVGFGAHASGDPTLRGLDVFVGAISDPASTGPVYAGTATNFGLIDAPRADVMVAGRSVNQLGFINSSTSVALNGRIDLLASYNARPSTNTVSSNPPPFLPIATGTITLGPDSVTQILPEISSTDRVVGAQLALPSTIKMQGLAIHGAENSAIFAPNAVVELDAGVWLTTGGASTIIDNFVFSDGQIYFDAGALVDVSGLTGVSASVAENIISAQLRGPELANSPLQRNGPLRGQTIRIDIRDTGVFDGKAWIGTPLADLSGYVNLIRRTVAELSTVGGTVNLNAGGSVVLQRGAMIDVSGGSIDYQGALVQTSKVVSGGQLFDISQATPDRVYSGLYTGSIVDYSKWGIVQVFMNPLETGGHFEAGYMQGMNGGSINITAPSMALDGALRGNTVAGPRQRAAQPAPSTLALNFQAQSSNGSLIFPTSPTPPNISFSRNSNLAPADPFTLDANGEPMLLRHDRQVDVILSPDLVSVDGFGNLRVNDGDGAITVPSEITLATSTGGSISLAAANIDIRGNIIAPSGSLNFTAYDFSPFAFAQPNFGGEMPMSDPTRGRFILGPNASLSAAGLIVDDRQDTLTANTLPISTNGGSITIRAFNANIARGSQIDVSGGVRVDNTGKATYGNGGSIGILAGQDANIAALLGGRLTLSGNLRGFSGANGGSLSLLAPSVQVGGTTENPDALLLSPNFFNRGGFTGFSINGLGAATNRVDEYLPAVVIAPGVTIAPVAQNLIAAPDAADVIELTPTVLPQGLRTPVNLAFGATGVVDILRGGILIVRGDIVMSLGSTIRTDPLANVTMSGQTTAVRGSIMAPGGTITISGGSNSTTLFSSQQSALPTVDIGPNSLLSAAGTTLLTLNSLGFRTGSVLAGGTISVSGNIVAEAGSTLNVSGATDVLDLSPSAIGAPSGTEQVTSDSFVPARVDSNAGTVILKGGQELFSDARFSGEAGGPSAQRGTLSISSGRFYSPTVNVVPTPLDVTLVVAQYGPTIPAPFYGPGETAIGHVVVDLNGDPLPQLGHFTANDFNTSGMGALSLGGTVEFAGSVGIDAPRSIAIGSGGVIYGNSSIALNAPYIALGTGFQPPLAPQQIVSAFTAGNQSFYFSPTHGDGSLNVNARLIDVGNLSLQSIGTANLTATLGDLRGNGTLDIAGKLNITAGQIYPPTATTFTLAAYDYVDGGANRLGSITIRKSGERQLPLAAGGQLNLEAALINNEGVLRAPIGTINLGWNGTGSAPIDLITGQAVPAAQQVTLAAGSTTSVSAIDPLTGKALLIPYGVNQNGTSWIAPTGLDITAGNAPEKSIAISAASVFDRGGSVIDVRGGGDLFAYQFNPGTGGTIDLLNSSSSFAVIPSYQADYAPFAPYNPTPINTDFGSDSGYVNSGLAIGDRVFLNAGGGLASGAYTLLPARYALLPGAFLVTPQSALAGGQTTLPDGSAIVLGYRFNDLNWSGAARPMNTSFEIASANVLNARAQYINFSANTFLKQGALTHDAAVPRLPLDSGHLLLDATEAMRVQGSLISQSVSGGRGGEVDIQSPVDILISHTAASSPGVLVLDAAELSSFGAESLLIGGSRQNTANGVQVTVRTNNLTLDSGGTPLSGQDIILVANQTLTLAPNADLESSGAVTSAETLLFGNPSVAGSGNGVLVRASSDPGARIIRTGLSSSTLPALAIGAHAHIGGGSVTLDSTNATTLNATAGFSASFINLNSGRISIQLDDPGSLQPDAGLLLAGTALQTLQHASLGFSLLSYTSIDIYGHGEIGPLDPNGIPALTSLALHAGEIRGFNSGLGVTFASGDVTLDNAAQSRGPAPVAAPGGTLAFDAQTVHLGSNSLEIAQFANLALNASEGIIAQDAGTLTTQGNLFANTPLITGATAADHSIIAGGLFSLQTPGTAPANSITAGLGVRLTLEGSSLIENSNVLLPSGIATLHATGGNLSVGGTINVSGTAQTFFDTIKYTDAGQVSLIADFGDISLTSGSTINVAAQSAAGNAGTLMVNLQGGSFIAAGTLLASGGAGGENGNFALDVQTLPTLGALDAVLNAANFTQSRTFRVRRGDVLVNGTATAHSFNLSADQGAITVSGLINAAGAVGGVINLAARENVTLERSANLSVAGVALDAAGKGGAISLETTNGRIGIRQGSVMDLSVANHAGGTLHLRAPQIAGPDFVALDSLAGTITNANSIIAEGFFAQDANTTGAASIDVMEAAAFANATAFMTNATQIQSRLLATNSSLVGVLHVRPGEEIDNSQGDLILEHDWDLSTWRFGARQAVVDDAGHPLHDINGNPIFAGAEPGVLTLRARGSIILHGSLTDGFGDSAGAIDYPVDLNGNPALWKELLLPRFADGNSQESWSYRITAGADFTAADFHQVLPLAALGGNSGSLRIGVNGGTNIANPFGHDAIGETAIAGHFQVIRTGTGDIDISAGRDVQLLNPFATIYTAGTLVKNPTLNGTFDFPRLDPSDGTDPLGAVQEIPAYPAQYSYAGGNVTIFAQNNIEHLTQDDAGNLIADSSKELPNNWLYRRGYVEPTTGQFGTARFGDIASTTWWIDFSNFFEGVGALGGGNVAIKSGNNISNVDAVVPTNARMPKGTPSANRLVEFGGGDLLVTAAHDLDGGVYYVERGQGVLRAGDMIHTNSTRSPSLTTIVSPSDISPEQTWLPTTLFVGKGSFDVSARGDILLGPVANPFLLPEGYSNTFWYKTYFSTYAPTDSIQLSSLTGSVTLRQAATPPAEGISNSLPILQLWLQNVSLLATAAQTVALYQPWLRLDETSVDPFATLVGLMPPALHIAAFSGDVNLIGSMTLSPAAQGTLDIAALGPINGLQPSGVTTVRGLPTANWSAATINVSDSDPNAIPAIASPLALQSIVGTVANLANRTNSQFLNPVDNLFAESGSVTGNHAVLQAKQALHAAGVLHRNDPQVVHLYSQNGNISGLTLFSPTVTHIIAGRDITDVAFYLQNVAAGNVSVVAAGRDLIAFDPNSSLRTAAQFLGNALTLAATPLAGDIQISGPGTLEVLAGRNFDLGVGPSNTDGTGVGITSIGNARNPFLPFAGSDIIAGAGAGAISNLHNSALDFDKFISNFLDPTSAESSRYLPELGKLLDVSGMSETAVWNLFQQLPIEQRDRLALDIFYLVLRDAGRDHNDSSSEFRNYENGYAAVQSLFPGNKWQGDISLTSREIKTSNGGNISVFAPGGGLLVGFDLGTNQPVDQGILTEGGGNISIFASKNVDVGTSRIFTLRGGNIIIWSTLGDIAAGSAAKTVQSAPPTRVLIDPQSGDVATDLAGLATGGGIGVLETVTGVPPGDIDLVAPIGTVNAGDAGIRVSGNLNIAAVLVVNAGNIQVGGASAGVPVVAAPNVGGLTAASSATAATANAANDLAGRNQEPVAQEEVPSIITVEVIGYGGGDNDGNGDDDKKRRKKQEQQLERL
jgi:filamentous hemagglutinin